ncbi:MAG: transcription antitermination factor NusB [Streptococcaceae bacterium]|jgi:N utilization substance protein B|nr:transcription antitermination factor NusB [Streptococcaceae bacterium]
MQTDQERLTQHEVRKIALQFLYSKEVRPDQSDSDLLTYILNGRVFNQKNQEFFNLLTRGVLDNYKTIDQKLAEFLMKTWSIERMTTIDRSVARLGAYEILYSDTPDRVAIDEAINLSKDFSDKAAMKLINGLLTNLIKKDEC